MRGVAHLLALEPRHVLGSPRRDFLRPTKAELKQEFPEPISMTKLVSLGGMTRSNQIPQGLLLGIGNPDRRQIATPKETRELLRVSTIRLYPVACLDRDERRRDHVALDP